MGAGGVIFRTQDFGETWIEIKTDSYEGLQAVKILSEERVVGVGNKGTIAYSKDSGFNWEFRNSGKIFNLNRIVTSHDNTTGYIFGNKGTIIQFKLRN